MTDLQQLIAMGPVEAQVTLPVAVVDPPSKRLRRAEPHQSGAAFSDAELSQLRHLGVDLDQLGI